MIKAVLAVPDQRLFWDRWHTSKRHTVASHSDHSEAALRTFVAALPQEDDLNILEIGCGQGREAVSLARRGFCVNAFDRSPVAIDAARSNSAREGLKVDFREHDTARPLPYESQAFAGAFAHLSLHYFDDITTRRIIEEIERVLVSGGVLSLTIRSVRDDLYRIGNEVGDNMFCLEGHVRHFFDEKYVRDLLSNWDVQLAEYYDTSDRTVNPGVFMKVLAARS